MSHPSISADCDVAPYHAIELFGGDLADEKIRVRSRLADGGPIEVDYLEGDDWQATKWLHTDGTEDFLRRAGEVLAAEACQMPVESFRCQRRRIAT